MSLNTIFLDAAAGTDATGAGTDAGMMNLIMIVGLIAIFYFFMIRPQQKKQKEIRKFRDSLERGKKVITAGGIIGKIISVDNAIITLEIADNVRIKIDKSSVYEYNDNFDSSEINRQN